MQRGALPQPKTGADRTFWQWLFPSTTTSIRQESTTWWHKLALRGSAYVLALLVLGFLAGHRLYVPTAAVAVVVAIFGIRVHRTLATMADDGTRTRVRVGFLAALIGIGIAICFAFQWHVFGAWGFVGLSFIGFGLGQLMAEIRHAGRLNRIVATLLLGAALAGLVASAGFGIGGWLLLVVSVVLAAPAISLSTEVAMNWLDARKDTRTDVESGTAGADRPGHRWLLAVGGALLVVGAALVVPVGGLRFALLVGGLLFLVVGAIASNTDADIVFVLVAVAVVWSQFPRTDTPPVRTASAATRRLVVLGDSYISGEGAKNYYVGTNTTKPAEYDQCRRAPTAWPVALADGRQEAVDTVACSGAKAVNLFTRGQYIGENPKDLRRNRDGTEATPLSQYDLLQRNGGKEPIDWVFVSIGGNDVGFGDLVQLCIAPGDCSTRGQAWLDRLRDIGTTLDPVYQQLRDAFGDKVVIVPYPIPIRDRSCSIFSSTYTDREHAFLSAFTERLDDTIRATAQRNGLRFLSDMRDAFDVGDVHARICDTSASGAAVNYLALNPVGGRIDPTGWLHDSMHPKEAGHGFMKAAAERWLAADEAHRAVEAGVTVETKTLADIRVGGDPCTAAPQPASCTSTDGTWIFEQVRTAVRHRGPGVVGVIVGAWLIWLSLLLRGRVRRRVAATASAT